jgi:hypothetical protein
MFMRSLHHWYILLWFFRHGPIVTGQGVHRTNRLTGVTQVLIPGWRGKEEHWQFIECLLNFVCLLWVYATGLKLINCLRPSQQMYTFCIHWTHFCPTCKDKETTKQKKKDIVAHFPPHFSGLWWQELQTTMIISIILFLLTWTFANLS